MLLIIGLGNPGEDYFQTRHNVGYQVVDWLAESWKINFFPQGSALVGKKRDGGAILAKPLTYMNASGEAVKYLLVKHRLTAKDLLVISDDFSLPLGRIRLKLKGSSGGHRGLASIIAGVGSEDFPRLRMGIGPLPERASASDYVLKKFKKEEAGKVEKMAALAAEAVGTLLKEGWDKTMSRYNRDSDAS
ncbi:MAG: aminoacyl-tRNA hydrolase [Elusimicrobiota bacterium]